MKNKGFGLALLGLFFFNLGCSTLFYKKIEKPHYWLAEKEGKRIHILGTMHDFVSIKELPDWLLADLKSSQVLVLEAPPTDQAGAPLVSLLGRLNRGLVYSDLSKENWALYKAIFAKTNLGGMLLQKGHRIEMDNYVLANVIVQRFVKEQTDAVIDAANKGIIAVKKDYIDHLNEMTRELHSDAQMDRSLYEIAVEEDIVFDYLDRDLETLVEIEQQAAQKRFEYYLPIAKKILDDRKYALVHHENNVNRLSKLTRVYRSGQPIDIKDVVTHELGHQLRLELMEKRNSSWAKYLQNLETGYDKMFVGVGVGHLYGEGSFLKEIKKMGYKLSRQGEPKLAGQP